MIKGSCDFCAYLKYRGRRPKYNSFIYGYPVSIIAELVPPCPRPMSETAVPSPAEIY